MDQTRSKIKEMEVMVAETIYETPDTVTLVLFTGNDTLRYEPGHFLTISPHQFESLQRWVAFLEDAKGRKEPPRAYSLSSTPDEKYLAFTVKEERYVSGSTLYPPLLSPVLAKRTLPGSRMVITGFTGPYTLTEKVRSAYKEFVHICAGSGIVPSFSIIKHDLRMNPATKHTLLYGNKRLDDVIFFNELSKLEAQFPGRFRVIHALTRETDESLFQEKIHKGRISRERLEAAVPNFKESYFFVCGPDHNVWQKKAAKEKGTELPTSFMGSVLKIFGELGIPRSQMTTESYG